jgi:hypothetical protein
MICANRALYWSEGHRRRGLNTFASGQGRGGCGLSSGSGGDFLRHHAPALRISRSTAGGNYGQAHRDDTLSVKSHLPRIGPKLQGGMHFASPAGCERREERAQQVMFRPRVLKEQQQRLIGSEAGIVRVGQRRRACWTLLQLQFARAISRRRHRSHPRQRQAGWRHGLGGREPWEPCHLHHLRPENEWARALDKAAERLERGHSRAGVPSPWWRLFRALEPGSQGRTTLVSIKAVIADRMRPVGSNDGRL